MYDFIIRLYGFCMKLQFFELSLHCENLLPFIMKQELIITSAIAALLATSAVSATAKNATLLSPSGNISVAVEDAPDGNLTFSISANGEKLLLPSQIAMDFEGGKKAGKIKSTSIKKDIKESFDAPFYRNPHFTTQCNELTVRLTDGNSVTFRAYDDGVAYRFSTDGKTGNVVTDEKALYNVAGNPTIYLPHSTNEKAPEAMAFQNFYTVTPISSASPLLAFLPTTLDYGDGLKMTILESDLESYPGMFVEADSTSRSLKGVFAKYPSSTDFYPWRKQEYVTGRENYIAKISGKRNFPWRIFAVTTDDRQMPVNNLVYALASPSRVADTSWIKPGMAAWEWWNDWGLRGVPFKAGINNETYRYFIDFAADNGIEYVVLDEGWYVPKSGDMLTTIPEIDLPALVEYADKKGVGLWLWTVFNVLDTQLEEACKKYSDLGIKGFKVDFLDRDDQTAVDMTYRIADATARHNLMLDLHGFYKPTGLNRTYPNVMNFESVFGMEEMKWSPTSVDMPEYDVTFPYIRMMCGPVDFTPGAMRNASKKDWKAVYYNPESQGTRAHQVANYIVQDSPFTMLADSPSNYLDNQECTDFITAIPTVFDETSIMDGKMGEYIVTLRKKDNSWFIGGQTDWNPREYTVDFAFLPSGKDFKVTILKDGVNATKQAQDYELETLTVNSGTKKTIHMAPGGGFAIRLIP